MTPGKSQRTTLSCDNCRRITTPRPVRVALLIDGGYTVERHLCTACKVHVTETAIREPAPWLSTGSGYVR